MEGWQKELHKIKDEFNLSDEIVASIYIVISLAQAEIKDKVMDSVEKL